MPVSPMDYRSTVMLPSMTSSKFSRVPRFTLGHRSFSSPFHKSETHLPHAEPSHPEKHEGETRRESTGKEEGGVAPSSPPPDSTETEAAAPAYEITPPPPADEKHLGGEPVLAPSRPLNKRKSISWGARLSILFPSLIDQPADYPQPQEPVHRKPLPDTTAETTYSPVDSRHPLPPPPRFYDSPNASRPSTAPDLGLGITLADAAPHNPYPDTHIAFAPPPVPPKTRLGHSEPASTSPSSQLPLLPHHQPLSMAAPPVPPRDAPPSLPAKEPLPPARLRKEKHQQPLPTAPPPVPPRDDPQPPAKTVPHTEAQSHGRLRKENTEAHSRSASHHSRNESLPQLAVQTRGTSPSPESRGRSTSAQPPQARNQGSHARIVSTSGSLENQSPNRDEKRGRLRRNWLGRSRSGSQDMGHQSQAWMLSSSPEAQGEYKTSLLVNAEKVPELWNENGNVLVYLYPRATDPGPSFKIPAFAISSSQVFTELIQSSVNSNIARAGAGNSGHRNNLSVDSARSSTPSQGSGAENPGDVKLYVPPAPPSQNGQLLAPGKQHGPDLDRLVAVRNLFAFITGQPLVATKTHPTAYAVFLQIANLLQDFGFSNIAGSSFGDPVDLSFSFFINQMALSDVRHSREKTLEALVLGERMRSMELYSEAFAHAVGKYSAIIDLRSPLFEQVSLYTRQKMERAHFELVNRQHNVNMRLEQFEFPSLFAGIASSTSNNEIRQVRFKIWRNSFIKMRQFVLGYYKTSFGNWPPKASSKKNPFSESGLNRLVMKVLYSDMCALYDLLVDRESLTPRVIDETMEDTLNNDSTMLSALRKMLSEFDRSSPPVLPPVPFDIPRIPSMTAILATYNDLSAKEQARFDRKIKENELILVLHKAYNYDTHSLKIPFLSEFKDFEMKESRGKSAADLADQRVGYWLFLYVVIQSLPMLVIDAPALKFTEAVEYFLCQPPMGNPPWVEDARQVRKMWYEVSGGAGYVELSTDAVMYSVEAIYHRSHCWVAAKQWEDLPGSEALPPPQEVAMSPLEPPRAVFQSPDGMVSSPSPVSPGGPSPTSSSPQLAVRPRNASPGGPGRTAYRAGHAYRSSIALGLEPVPIPFAESPTGRSGDRSRVSTAHGPRSNSAGPRPLSHSMARSASATNLNMLAQNGYDSPTTGATFDDILGVTEQKATKKKKSKFF